jgi:hypothetical protein
VWTLNIFYTLTFARHSTQEPYARKRFCTKPLVPAWDDVLPLRDVHGTENYAQLREPVNKLCLDCHGPLSLHGPRTATLEGHTHHKAGSAGSQCVACHMPRIETTIADVKGTSAHLRLHP